MFLGSNIFNDMDELFFSFKDSLIPDEEIDKLGIGFGDVIKSMNDSASRGYDDDRASINLPFDNKAADKIMDVAQGKRELNPKGLVVVGIGGSILGARAVQEAVSGKLRNQCDPGMKVLYAGNADPCLIRDIKEVMESILESGGDVILNVVSKSGATTETLANFQLLVDLLSKHRSDYSKYVVATTERESGLWNLAVREDFDLLEIPEKVGGRFSVYSPAGLFPLALSGVDIDKLLEGARVMRDRCLKGGIRDNPAALGSIVTYLNHMRGNSTYNLFLYSEDFESIGGWHRQLVAESLGKEYNNKGERVFEGLTPLTCIGSRDLHSMAQLLLGGPYDKLTSFIKINGGDSGVNVPLNPVYSGLVDGIQGKSLDSIMDAIYEGVKVSFRKRDRPFTEVVLPDRGAASVGAFLQYKMMEVMYLGSLLDVNPFNQPNVESYKEESRRILGL